jgi:CheY-like chemotaxis protein
MNKDFPILIAEDCAEDAFILQRALRKVGFNNPFHVSPDGVDVIRYLKGDAPYENRQHYHFPRVLILDLKLPRMDGFEVLAWLQQHPECNVIPTIVLSTSGEPEEVKRAYQLGVNSYLVKPPTFDGLQRMLSLVFDYWQMCAKPELPPKC